MRNTLKMIGVLTTVGLISGAILALMYDYANPLILENQRQVGEHSIFTVFPEAKSYDKDTRTEEVIFKVKDKHEMLLGYAFVAEGNGYGGTIKMMLGLKPDLETLVGIEILESQETPGMGQEITTDKFKLQFKGLKATPEITYVKDRPPSKPGEIQAITGATISSSAVVLILNEKIKAIKEKLSKREVITDEERR